MKNYSLAGWTIQPLSRNTNDSMQDVLTIGQDQSTTIFFRIVPSNDTQRRNEKTKAFHTNHALSKNSKSKAEIDSSMNPFYDFLFREKVFIAEKKHETPETSSTDTQLDLILLWETSLDAEG